MKERDNLCPEKTEDGRHYLSPASYTLSKEEKEIIFECLSSMKVRSGFSSNIKGIINVSEKRFLNIKSHDCHVLMTQLLSIALRGILPSHVRLATMKLCAFLNAISQKAINLLKLATLQNDVIQYLVSFELVFAPSFFDIMTHLLVYLVKEINILSPVFLHNMFSFESFMEVLKKYGHQRARPEGSIANVSSVFQLLNPSRWVNYWFAWVFWAWSFTWETRVWNVGDVGGLGCGKHQCLTSLW